MRGLPALLLVVVLMAGCADDPGRPAGSAKAGEPVATAAAAEWTDDARLVAVLSSEETDAEFGKRGDGLGDAWGYLFTSPTMPGHLSIVVRANGEIALARTFELNATENALLRPTGGGEPITDWKIDSVDVADALADTFPRYYEVAGQEAMEMTMVLAQAEEGNPFWQFELREVERTKRLVLDGRMDATTGEFTKLLAEPELAEG